MKISEFQITRYGPLKAERYLLSDFNLFWGKNEEGKTLTIDALIKMLLGKVRDRDFFNINRVEEMPEGYMILEGEQGTVKLPERGLLTDELDLTPQEFRNIFVIRNSDLSLEQEGQFYTSVTHRLTGLKTEEIDEVIDVLRDIASITPTGIFKDDASSRKLKTRLERAEAAQKNMDDLLSTVAEEGLDELEERLVECREEIRDLQEKESMMEAARKRETYEKGKEALKDLKEAREKAEEYIVFTEEDEEVWRKQEFEWQKCTEEEENLKSSLEELEEQQKEAEENYSLEAQEYEPLKEKKSLAEREVRFLLKSCVASSEELAGRQAWSRLTAVTGIFAALFLAVALMGILLLDAELLFYILAAVFSLLIIGSLTYKVQTARKTEQHQRALENVKNLMAGMGIEGSTLEQMQREFQKFLDYCQKKEKSLQDQKNKIIRLKEKIEELRGKLPQIGRRKTQAKKIIDELKNKCQVDTREEHQAGLREKSENHNFYANQKGILNSLFGTKGEGEDEQIKFWEEQVLALEKYKETAQDIDYHEKTVSFYRQERQKLEELWQELDQKLMKYRDQLKEMEREVNSILEQEKDYIPCATAADLQEARKLLQDFRETHESMRDVAGKASEIFYEIKEEEKEKVSHLFGEESPVTSYFQNITMGHYDGVFYDGLADRIQVRDKQGKLFVADDLSGGTYDQLYLSIRLALGEKISKNNKGFFILDDPFLKSDDDRLIKQINTLEELASQGWQILYFSAKDEIRRALQDFQQSGKVQFFRISGLE